MAQPRTGAQLVQSLRDTYAQSPGHIIPTLRTHPPRDLSTGQRAIAAAALQQHLLHALTDTGMGNRLTPGTALTIDRQTDSYYIENDVNGNSAVLQAHIVYVAQRSR